MRGAQENFAYGKGRHFSAAVAVVVNIREWCAHNFLIEVKCDFVAFSGYGHGYFVQSSVRKHAHRNAIMILQFAFSEDLKVQTPCWGSST